LFVKKTSYVNFLLKKAGTWNLDEYTKKVFAKNPITTMLDIFGNIWCSSESTIFILNSETLTVEVNFLISYSFEIYFVFLLLTTLHVVIYMVIYHGISE
jgi:hypothetical protein